MRAPILSVEDLRYSYPGGKEALCGVTAQFYAGEKIAVVGANGSGKSTFFLNLNGVYTPTGGRVLYRGRLVEKKNLNDLRKNVGFVFQDADNQIIASTVRAEVGFGPMNLKLPRQEVLRRVDEALNYMNLSGFEDRPPHYLSGGEKKRVSIAGVLAMEPEILLFDEPTASLDPINAAMLEEVLTKLDSEGKTVLISTHDVDFTYRWADRVLVFRAGNIIADAPTLEIFRDRALLRQAGLARPAMLEVYETLVAHKMLDNTGAYPRIPRALNELLQKSGIT